MVKFKVGDRVKVVSREDGFPDHKKIGSFGTVSEVFDNLSGVDISIKWDDGKRSVGLYARQFALVAPEPYYENNTDYYLAITGDTDSV